MSKKLSSPVHAFCDGKRLSELSEIKEKALPSALSQKKSLSFPLRLSYKVRSSFITTFP